MKIYIAHLLKYNHGSGLWDLAGESDPYYHLTDLEADILSFNNWFHPIEQAIWQGDNLVACKDIRGKVVNQKGQIWVLSKPDFTYEYYCIQHETIFSYRL